jgi:hypothetical protein
MHEHRLTIQKEKDNMSKIASFNYDKCGVGNRVFQYAYARLFCEKNGHELSHSGIPELEIPANELGKAEINLYRPQRFLQDYNLYRDHLDSIKSWECFDPVDCVNENDLVIHLRAGNRFLAKNANHTSTAEELGKAIESIEFDKLHVVTNLSKYDEWTLEDINDAINRLKTKGGDGESAKKYREEYPFLNPEDALKYTNSFIDLFKKYDTIWTSSLLKDDFNYLRKFRKILFPRSTFSWWAAVTGVANEVYVYGPWAPHKSKTDGWLGETNYEGWKSWS